MNREVVVNLFKKVARILEDDKQYEWLADEVKDYLNEIYVNEEAELEQPEAWIIVNKETGYRTQVSDLTPFLYHREIFEVIPLYTAPPKREPFGPEERQRLSKAYSTRAEQVAFEEGIIFAEISYGIGVDDE